MDRISDLERLRENPKFDVIVIGGGATGLGAALDALSRGYRTLLLEACDFAKGTSSRSTKLIHGGVRYLRSGQVGMVRESLLERERLLHNASHVVHPMQFVVPSYHFGMRWYYWFGMKLYDFLAGSLNLEPSRMLSRSEALTLMPTIAPEGLRGGVLYSDGQFDDARLALALAETCYAEGGVVLNYARVDSLKIDRRRIAGVTFVDEETHTPHSASAKVVVNATGVFGESIMALDPASKGALNRQSPPPRIVPSQGTHVVLDRDFLPTDYAIMIPDTDDGRVLFVIPWYGKTLLGTTDLAVDDVSLDPLPQDEEIDYLLRHVARYLTRAPNREDVRSVFAGLRPLVGKPAKDDKDLPTSTLSREHEIYTSATGLISVIGGKWTTYRKMGEDVIDLALQVGRLPNYPSRTSYKVLVGGEEHDLDSTQSPSDPLAVFGNQASKIQSLMAENPQLREPIHVRLPYLQSHVVFAARFEAARTVDDVLARRTRALLMDAKAAEESAPTVAKLLRAELKRDCAWEESQVSDFQKLAKQYQA